MGTSGSPILLESRRRILAAWSVSIINHRPPDRDGAVARASAAERCMGERAATIRRLEYRLEPESGPENIPPEGGTPTTRVWIPSSPRMPIVVPEVNDRLVARMLVAQDAEGRRAQQEE